MFVSNIKSFIHYDSLKLTKNVYCSVCKSVLLEKTQLTNISKRCLMTKALGKGYEKPIIFNTRITNARRHIMIKPPNNLNKSPIKWKTVVITAIIGSAFVALLIYMKREKLRRIENYRNRQIGKAKLGGKFNLVNQDNQPVSSDDLLGHWLLLYFGFTHCPDICPDEIEKMVEVVDLIDKSEDIKKVKPIFITVDPERDTPGIIKKYLKEFSDKIIGLTGTVDQIAATCKAYRVYFSPGPKDSDSDYIVDHSIIMYLVDPQGKFIDFYGQNKTAKEIVASIQFNQLKREVGKSFLQNISEYFTKN